MPLSVDDLPDKAEQTAPEIAASAHEDTDHNAKSVMSGAAVGLTPSLSNTDRFTFPNMRAWEAGNILRDLAPYITALSPAEGRASDRRAERRQCARSQPVAIETLMA